MFCFNLFVFRAPDPDAQDAKIPEEDLPRWEVTDGSNFEAKPCPAWLFGFCILVVIKYYWCTAGVISQTVEHWSVLMWCGLEKVLILMYLVLLMQLWTNVICVFWWGYLIYFFQIPSSYNQNTFRLQKKNDHWTPRANLFKWSLDRV